MTLDEAIQHCEEVADTPCFTDEEARCYSEHRQLAEWLKELKAYREQSGDAISKEQLIRELNAQMAVGAITREIALDMLTHLLSVTPQQRTGRWELVRYDGLIGNWHCSECRTIIPHMPEETDNTPIYKWCPMCGAKMEVEK